MEVKSYATDPVYEMQNHPAHHLVYLGQAQFLRALQAQPLVDGLALFNLRNEDHGYPLFFCCGWP